MRGRSLSLAAVLALAALPARADVTAYIEQSTARGEQDTSIGPAEARTNSLQWLQRYRLDWDQRPWPQVGVGAGATLDWIRGWSDTGPISSETDQKRWTGYGRLNFGSPILGGGLRYDHSAELARATTGGVSASAPTLLRDAWSASASWRPVDLPTLDVNYSRTHQYDQDRRLADLTTDQVNVGSAYRPARSLDLSYGLRWADANDALNGLDQRELLNSGRISWSDALSSRLRASASYSVANRQSWTDVLSLNATVTTQQFPTAGYSLVEAFPATPERDTLAENPALIDRDVTLGAGQPPLDIGFQRSLSGDLAFRDVGAQFGNALSTVNRVYVYVDRQLPADVAAAFTWTAYRSDDNVVWTPVPIAGPVQFGLFDNRFEIPIDQAQARFLKVVVKPLLASVTTDPRFASILVTEVQFLLVVPASQVKRHDSVTSGMASASARYLILPSINLAFDNSSSFNHSDNPASHTWATLNGLSMARQLTPVTGVSARVDRADSDFGHGHESLSRASAALALSPLPTLSGGASVSGQVAQTQLGTSWSAGPTVFASADLYTGLTVSAAGSYGYGENERGVTSSGWNVAASASATPNRKMSLGVTYGLNQGAVSGPTLSERSQSSSRLDATMTLTPIPVLYLAGGVSRLWTEGAPSSTRANFNLSFTPFPGGDLLLRFGYTETAEPTAGLRDRQWGPGLRWNIRRGWYLDLSYQVAATRSPAVDTDTRTFFADLVVSLR